MLRVVLDTNILISAILFGGKPRQILEKAICGDIRLCVSKPILEELGGVLGRPKFDYSPEIDSRCFHGTYEYCRFCGSLRDY